MSTDTWFIDEAKDFVEKKEKNYYCTIFLQKNNKPVITFRVGTSDEVMVKYICITKWYLGKEKAKIFEESVLKNNKLTKETLKMVEDFDKKFRLLVSNK